MQLPSFSDVQIDLSPWDLPDTPFFVRMYEAAIPEISGNKAFKLWPYLETCRKGETILSWGGAYSNHLLALSAAAKLGGLKAVGIVRGDEAGIDNTWIRAMRQNGMTLHFVSRNEYNLRNDKIYCTELALKFEAGVIVPEGGKGREGIRGAMSMVHESEPYSFIAVPGGTGTTAAGIAQKVARCNIQVICLQALKGEGAIWKELEECNGLNRQHLPNLNIIDSLNLGHFGAEHPDAASFRRDFYRHTSIALDTVYGSKAMLGLVRLLQKGALPASEPMLYIHTGGLGPR